MARILDFRTGVAIPDMKIVARGYKWFGRFAPESAGDFAQVMQPILLRALSEQEEDEGLASIFGPENHEKRAGE